MKCDYGCKYCKVYPGSYWEPDDVECHHPTITDDELDKYFSDKVNNCPYYEEIVLENDYYLEDAR